MARPKLDSVRQRKLPPLILHPFTDPAGPDKLAESSRASLMLQGLLPNCDFTMEELNRRVLDGRFYEIRMLYYVGRDLTRWIGQCMEVVGRDTELPSAGIQEQSFASLLADDLPLPVREKLRGWGVMEHRSIFTRALGLNSVFTVAPDRDGLTEEFIRHHYRFADQLFQCHQQLAAFTRLRSSDFSFELYASGEYARMLERQWEEGA